MSVSTDTTIALGCLAALAQEGFDATETAMTTILAAMTTHLGWQSSFVACANIGARQLTIVAAHHTADGLPLTLGSVIAPASAETAFWQHAPAGVGVTRIIAPLPGFVMGAAISLKDGTCWGILGDLTSVASAWTPEHAGVVRVLARRLADEIDRQQQREHLNAMKGDFVSIVSHEFRTALMSILGFSQMLRDEPCSPTEIQEFAADIFSDATRINRMITDMLDLDRIESGRVKLTLTEVDLNALLQDTTSRFMATTANHTFRWQLTPTLPLVVADADKVVQIVTNLLTNAIKYSPKGGEIAVGVTADGGCAHLWVRDQGMGIAADALERIFERYARIEAKTSRYIQGTGLGLPIVRQLAQMHGGQAWAESIPGCGSTFHVTLPLPQPARHAQ